MTEPVRDDFPCYPLDSTEFIGSQELSFILKDENLFSMDCMQSEMKAGNYSAISYMNVPDTTIVSSVVPHPTSRLPSMEDYPGPLSFDMEFNKPGLDKGKWEFSKPLNKIFVKMECKVPLTFKWKQQEWGLFVRALPVFLNQDDFEEAVRRCASHESHLEKSNEGFQFADHIIRCEHPNTVYEKNPESERLSIRVPLDRPQPGADGTTIIYRFMCKNSCQVGMNRRSTGLIFTLEQESGEVVGRKMIKMRICSCPLRDLKKEEKEEREIKKEEKEERDIKKEEKEERDIKKEEKEERDMRDKSLIGKRANSEDVLQPAKIPQTKVSKKAEGRNVQIRLSGSVENLAPVFATMVKTALLCKSELTHVDKVTLEDCDKYL